MSHLDLRPVSIIGAPTDIGASRIGGRMGPAALRIAGIVAAVARFGCNARDCGDLAGPINPDLPPVNGYRHLAEVVAWNRRTHEAAYAELCDERLPMLLGGDHSLSMGTISAVARYCRQRSKKLRVLWFDAHADFNTSSITPSGNLHGMPLACLCGFGPSELVELAGFVPALRPSDIRLIGIRDVDAGEKHLLKEESVPVYDMRDIDEIGMRRTLEMALEGVDENTHLHVSLDVDFLDSDIAPGVSTPVRGGPTYREAQLCMEMIADTGLLASLDIVEVNPALDRGNMTAMLAVDLVESLFGKSTLLRMNRT